MFGQFLWAPIPFVRYAVVFALGMAIADAGVMINISLDFLLLCFVGCVLLLVGLYAAYAYSYLPGLIFPDFFGALALVILLFAGFLFYRIEMLRHRLIIDRVIAMEVEDYIGLVEFDPVHAVGKKTKYTLKLLLVNEKGSDWQPVKGGSLLYLPELDTNYVAGDVLLVRGKLNLIGPPSNPYTFDYQTFMMRKGIYFREFSKPQFVLKIDSQHQNVLVRWLNASRRYSKQLIDENIHSPTERGLLLPLLLGYKSSIPRDLKKSYQASGAMHVLAVSGLHVGIIYLVVMSLIGWLRRYAYGKWFCLLLSLLILWFYALLTGLSASVVRATFMFSIFALAKVLQRNANVYNNIALAAFVILIAQPFSLFDVGFQLSFSAIAGIVFFQPKLVAMWSPKFLILQKCWTLTTLAFAAQLSTFPITVYYFNQFPTYFWLSNLVVIPAAFTIIITSLIMLILSLIAVPITPIAIVLSKVVYLTNQAIHAVTQLPFHLIHPLYISELQLMLLLIMIIGMGYFITSKKYVGLTIIALSFLLFCVENIIESLDKKQQLKFIVYDTHNWCVIDLISRGQHNSIIYYNKKATADDLMYPVYNFRIKSKLALEDLKIDVHNKLNANVAPYEFFTLGQKKGLIINRPLVFSPNDKTKIKINFLLINNQSITNFEDLDSHYKFDQLIISNLNGSKYAALLAKFSFEKDWVVHNVNRQGAFMMDLSE